MGRIGEFLKTLGEFSGKGLTYWDFSWYCCCSVMVFYRVILLGRKGFDWFFVKVFFSIRGYRGGWGKGCCRGTVKGLGITLLEFAENFNVFGILKVDFTDYLEEEMGYEFKVCLKMCSLEGNTRFSGFVEVRSAVEVEERLERRIFTAFIRSFL